jgi:hypothetical protein
MIYREACSRSMAAHKTATPQWVDSFEIWLELSRPGHAPQGNEWEPAMGTFWGA